MANKATPYSVDYSVKYNIGNSNAQPAQAKPRMLSISSVPDDHLVIMDYVDERGLMFDKTGNFLLPEFDEIERENLVLGGRKAGAPQFSMPDFAFNRICEPDSNQKGLELAQQLIAKNKIPVLNPPEKILATKRDVIYQRFAHSDGIVVPKTLRVAPRYCRDVRALLEQGEINLPCIFRPVGGHNSEGIFLIKESGDTNELERFAFDGRDYYISEFYDCRDSDGLYRKFRVVYVDGKLYPRHLFISNDWCVDAKTKFVEEKYFSEERHFLENFQSCLGDEIHARLSGFCARFGLDFFGLDLNLRPDGTLVLFEANASMSVFHAPSREYLAPYIGNIRGAIVEMMLRFHQTITHKSEI